MLIAELPYSFDPKAATPEQFEAYRANWPCANKNIAQEKYDSWMLVRTQRVTLEEAAALQDAGIKIDLRGIDGTMLVKMKDRNPAKGGPQVSDILTGSTVQISVPDLGLLQIDEVDWIEDACTQELQTRLSDGWRILAVCPPNAQRRPDYILGRRKQKD